MEKRLDAALVGLGWPGQVKARHGAGESDAMREVREAMVALLLLQHVAAAAGGGGDGGLWVLHRLVAPLLKRFRFHFETRRETNRRDKPEWVYSHCASLLRQHGAFLAESLQPVLLAPLPRLAALWVDAAAAADERQAYVRMVGARCPQGVYLTVVGALCDAIHAKLMREMRGLLAHMPLYAHTLNETISFERELRATLKVPRYVPTALRAFHASADALKLWLSVEASDGLAKLQQLAASTRAWDSPGGEAADGGLRAPSCVVGAMKHLRHLVGRLELIDDAAALRRMLDEVMLPLLDQLLSHVRARAAVLMVNEHQAGRWVEVGRLLHAVDFCSPLLADWQEWEMFVLLAPPPPRAASGEAAVAGVFARHLGELHELALELEAHAHETIQSHFETRCRPYVQERHRLRIDAPREAAVSLDVSPSFCAPILELRGELDGLRAAFPPPSLGRAWQAIAAGIDEMLAAQLLRHAHFSADGALQLRHDVHALLALFKPLTARPHAAFPRLHESCLALTLAPPRRAQLMELLLAAPSDAPGAEDAAAGQLTAALEAEGIFHLKPTEIRELLSRVHGGEE